MEAQNSVFWYTISNISVADISNDKDGNLVSLVRLAPRPNCAIFHAIIQPQAPLTTDDDDN